VLTDLVEGKTWEFRIGSGDHLFGFERRGNKVRWFRTGSNAGLSEYNWAVEDDFIRIGTDTCEVRLDVSGSFGEVMFLSTKNRYRMEPSTKTIPGK
jgi:hypothetical protein